MKSIERDFKRALKTNPGLGEYPALVRAVEHKKYTRRTIGKNIYLLGNKDIDASMKKALVDQLYEQSQKEPEECKNNTRNARDEEMTEYLGTDSLVRRVGVLG